MQTGFVMWARAVWVYCAEICPESGGGQQAGGRRAAGAVQVHLENKAETWELWLDNAKVATPVLEDDGKERLRPLLPRLCREMVCL